MHAAPQREKEHSEVCSAGPAYVRMIDHTVPSQAEERLRTS